MPLIPVNVRLPGVDEDVNSEDLAAILIKRTSRIFVEGAPGSGKTTLTRRVTLNLAHDALTPGSRLIPILVTLRSGVPNTIEEALQRACVDMGVRVFPALYRKALERAHVVLVLDGLDEVLDADTVMIVITCSADRDRSSDQSDGTR